MAKNIMGDTFKTEWRAFAEKEGGHWTLSETDIARVAFFMGGTTFLLGMTRTFLAMPGPPDQDEYIQMLKDLADELRAFDKAGGH